MTALSGCGLFQEGRPCGRRQGIQIRVHHPQKVGLNTARVSPGCIELVVQGHGGTRGPGRGGGAQVQHGNPRASRLPLVPTGGSGMRFVNWGRRPGADRPAAAGGREPDGDHVAGVCQRLHQAHGPPRGGEQEVGPRRPQRLLQRHHRHPLLPFAIPSLKAASHSRTTPTSPSAPLTALRRTSSRFGLPPEWTA